MKLIFNLMTRQRSCRICNNMQFTGYCKIFGVYITEYSSNPMSSPIRAQTCGKYLSVKSISRIKRL